MCTSATAHRRRQQARNGYKHLSKQRRPHYRRTDATAAAKRLQQLIARERALQNRKSSSK